MFLRQLGAVDPDDAPAGRPPARAARASRASTSGSSARARSAWPVDAERVHADRRGATVVPHEQRTVVVRPVDLRAEHRRAALRRTPRAHRG